MIFFARPLSQNIYHMTHLIINVPKHTVRIKWYGRDIIKMLFKLLPIVSDTNYLTLLSNTLLKNNAQFYLVTIIE